MMISLLKLSRYHIVLWVLLAIQMSCGGDKLSEDMEPEITRVLEGVRFEYESASIPEGLSAQFTIYGQYNDLTEEALTTEEMQNSIAWEVNIEDGFSINFSTNSVSLTGLGTASLTVSYTHDNQTFTATNDYEITKPVVVSIAVEEVLNSPDLESCCSDVTDVTGQVVKGCVRQFRAVGTFDNLLNKDLDASTVNWSSSSENAQLLDNASGLVNYPVIQACIDNLESKNGIILANEIGAFEISADNSGVKGTSNEIRIIAPTVVGMKFGSKPLVMISDNDAVFSVIGSYNNDTTSDISDIVTWSTADSSYAEFLVTKPSGTLTSHDATDDLEITVSHLTAGEIKSLIDITAKQLLYVKIDPSSLSISWNEEHQLNLYGYYDNNKSEKLESNVAWTSSNSSVATIEGSEGLLTSHQPAASDATTDVTAVYTISGSDTTSDSIVVHVTSDKGDLIEIQAMPGTVELIEGIPVPITIKGFYSNMSQHNILPDDVASDTTSDLIISKDENQFFLTANDVNNNASVSYSVEFTHNDKASTVQITDIYDTQIKALSIIKPKDSIAEGSKLQLSLSGTFLGFDTLSLPNDQVTWTCSHQTVDCNGAVSEGLFTAPNISSDEIFEISASISAHDIGFPNQVEDVSATTTIQVYKTPLVSFEEGSSEATESSGTRSIAVNVDKAIDQDIVIPYTVSGDASIDIDFQLSNPHQIVIPAGDQTAYLNVTLKEDDFSEDDEEIVFTIDSDNIINASIGTLDQHRLNINDSNLVKVSFNEESQIVTESVGAISIPVELNFKHFQDVMVYYSVNPLPGCTSDGTRKASIKDYDSSTIGNSILIISGSLTNFITVDVSDDVYHETDECFELTLTNSSADIDISKNIHTVYIKDNDPLKFFDLPPDTDITNNGTYQQPFEVTQFDPSGDERIFNVYNQPDWMDPISYSTYPLYLQGTPNKLQIGPQSKNTVICVSDADGSAYSTAPGAQTVCHPFNIEVLTCTLDSVTGSIGYWDTYKDPDNACGSKAGTIDNHITIGGSEQAGTLTMDSVDQFTGILLIGSGATFRMESAATDQNALIEIDKGTVLINGVSEIPGVIKLNGDATFDIQANSQLNKSENPITFNDSTADAKLSIILQGDNSSLAGQPIIVNSENGVLDINANGTGNYIHEITINADQNGSNGYIDLSGDVTLDSLNLDANSYLKINAGLLTVNNNTDVTGDVSLTLDSAGELAFNGNFEFDTSAPIYLYNNSTVAPKSQFNIKSLLELQGTGTLDLRSADIKISANLDAGSENITLLTSNTSTSLELENFAYIFSKNHISLNTLSLNNYLLDLGSNVPGLDVSNDVYISNASSDLSALNGQALLFEGKLFVSNGSLNSEQGIVKLNGGIEMNGGSIDILDGTTDVHGGNFAGGNLDLSGTKITIYEDTVIGTENLKQTSSTNWHILPSRKLEWNGQSNSDFSGQLEIDASSDFLITPAPTNNVFGRITGSISLNGGSISLTDSVAIAGKLSLTESSEIKINDGVTLTYSHPEALVLEDNNLQLSGGGHFSNGPTNPIRLTNSIGELILGNGASDLGSLNYLHANTSSGDGIIRLISDYQVEQLDVSSDVAITHSEKILSINDLKLPAGRKITYDGGTLKLINDLELYGTLETSNAAILDLTEANSIRISGELNTATDDGELKTSENELTLEGDTTINSLQDLSFGTITFNGHTLTKNSDIVLSDSSTDIIGPGTISGGKVKADSNSILNLSNVVFDEMGVDISRSTINFNGTSQLLNAAFDSTSDCLININGDLTFSPTASSSPAGIWTLVSNSSFSWNGNGTLEGQLRLNNNSQVLVHSNPAVIEAEIVVENDASMDIESSVIYQGPAIDLNKQLTMEGGTFTNDNNILVNQNGILILTEDSGEVKNVTLQANNTTNAGLEVYAEYQIDHLTLNDSNRIYIDDSQSLTIQDTLVVPEGETFIVDGKGTLILLGGLEVQSGASLSIEDSATLQVVGDLNVVDVNGLNLNGGKLDLTNVILVLQDDLAIDGNNLITDASTDIYLDSHNLTWKASNDTLYGTVYIGDSSDDNDSIFTVSGTNPTINADLYLRGGTLRITTDTTMDGDIYHEASSRIEIVNGAEFFYYGKALAVNSHQLTLSGGGDFTNSEAVTLNHSDSILNIDTSQGVLSNLDATADGSRVRVQHNRSYTIDTLNPQAELSIDTSSDSLLTISNPVLVPTGAQLDITGLGDVELTRLNLEGGNLYQITHQEMVLGGAYITSGVTLSTQESTLILEGDVTGDGTFQSEDSIIQIMNNVNLLLSSSGILTTDASTDWRIPVGSTLTWNGLGGTLMGIVDVSSDGILHLPQSQAVFEDQVNLEGRLQADVTTDIQTLNILQGSPKISLNNFSQLTIGEDLTIPGGANLDVSGDGVVNLQGLRVEEDMSLEDTDLELSGDVTTDGTLTLTGSTLAFHGTDPLSLTGSGTLTLTNAWVSTSQDVTVDIETINVDNTSGWLIGGGTLTWDLDTPVSGERVTLGSNGTFQITRENTTISADLYFSNGVFHSDVTCDVQGQLITDATADIKINDGTLTYSGNDFELQGNTLLLSGNGHIANESGGTPNWIVLNGTGGSTLHATDSSNGGIVQHVKVEATDKSFFQIDQDYTIEQLVVLSDLEIDIAVDQSLTIDATLDVQNSATLTLTGEGELIVPGGFTVGTGSHIVVQEGKLHVASNVVIEDNGSIQLDGGTLSYPDNQSIEITGNGTLDLIGKTYTLLGDMTITSGLSTDESTEIYLKSHDLILTTDNQTVNGEIYIGDYTTESGTFMIEGENTTIDADIYLLGGSLKIEVDTTMDGDIFHKASSTIEISDTAEFFYYGEPLKVDPYELTLAGGGDFTNSETLALNNNLSNLKVISTSGILQEMDVTADAKLSMQEGSDYTTNTLNMEASLTIDSSSDSYLTIVQPVTVNTGLTLDLQGPGSVTLSQLNLTEGAFNQSNGQSLSLDGVYLQGAGTILSKESTLILKGDVTGNGTFRTDDTTIRIEAATTMALTNASSLDTDTSTDWKISNSTFSFDGLGGTLYGIVDVSSDGILQTTGNPAVFGNQIDLKGEFKVDVSTDVKTLNVPEGSAKVTLGNNERLTVQDPLTITADTTLDVSGIGSLYLNQLTVESDGTLTASDINLHLSLNPSIEGDLILTNSTLSLDEGVTYLQNAGPGNLILTNSLVYTTEDVTVDNLNIIIDTSSDWEVDGGSITWKLDDVTGKEVRMMNGGTFEVTQENVNVAADLRFDNGTFISDVTCDVKGNLLTDTTADIEINNGTLTYSGEDFELLGKTLKLSGNGRIANEDESNTPKWILLNGDGGSTLHATETSTDGSVQHVKVNASDTSFIQINQDYTIDQLVVLSDLDLFIAADQSLTIDSTLDVRNEATLRLTGPGKLNVPGGFILGSNSHVTVEKGSLYVESEVEIGTDGSIKLEGGTLSYPENPGISISGDGKLDLSGKAYTLLGNMTITSGLTTDESTEIYLGSHRLTWVAVNGQTLDGEVYIGEELSEDDGTFIIQGTNPIIDADIYLWGGTLEIAVDTTMDGDIFHKASSTIEISNMAEFLYNGEPLKVDPYELTLSGGGDFTNSETLALNNNLSNLKVIATSGTLQEIDVTADAKLSMQEYSSYTINNLNLEAVLTIDTSNDSNLTIQTQLDIQDPAMLTAIGEGHITFQGLSLDATSDFSNTAGITFNGSIDTSSDAFFIANSISINFDSASDISVTGDGTIDLDNSTILVNSNLWINLDETATLSNTATQWSINDHTLGWNGLGGNLKGSIDISSDAKLSIYGNSATIDSDIQLYQGQIDIDATTDIEGTMTTHAGYDVTMDVTSGIALSLSQPVFETNSSQLHVSGGGNVSFNQLLIQEKTDLEYVDVLLEHDLIVNGLLSVKNASLTFDGSSDEIKGSGSMNLAETSINLNRDLTLSIPISGDTTSDWILQGNQLTWDTTSHLDGEKIVMGSAGSLIVTQPISINSAVDLSQGEVEIQSDTVLNGNMTTLTGDATIDVDDDIYLDYLGEEFSIADNVLSLIGKGVIDNTSDVSLNDSQSLLYLNGENGMLHKAKFSADSSNDKGIWADSDYVIQQLTVDNAKGIITVSDGKTLIIGDKLLSQGTENKITANVLGSGKLIIHEVYLTGDLELEGNITLAPDATLYVLSDSVLTISSDLHFNDGIIVKDGAKLTIEGGDHTVTFAGGYNLGTSGDVDVSGDVAMEIISSDIDQSDDWDRTTTDSGTGQTKPSKATTLDVLSFKAVSENNNISLSWEYQPGSFSSVLICRSDIGYPDTTTDGVIYNDTGVAFNDNVTNGISYYYTAFAHDGSGNYAEGVHAMAAATKVSSGLISYYLAGSRDCTDDVFLDSCGSINHGTCMNYLDAATDATGDVSGALYFDGFDAVEIDNPFVEVQSIDSNSVVQDFSISFWILTTQTGGAPGDNWFDDDTIPIIDGKIGVDQNDFGIVLDNGKIVFGLEYEGAAYNLSGSTNIDDGIWHHVVVTYKYSTGYQTIYLDGTSDATADGPVEKTFDSPSFLGIGRSPFGQTYFEGSLDEIRFYNRLLSEAEILELSTF